MYVHIWYIVHTYDDKEYKYRDDDEGHERNILK